jgi:transcriptional regulator with XRE-family HTH domain
MTRTNNLAQSPPFAVEQAVGTLGSNLKTARLRRRLTIVEVAERIGVGTRAVSDAEHGKTTTSVSTYMALLWVYGLLEDMQDVASPLKDSEGLNLAANRAPQRARKNDMGLSNDF